MKLYVWHGVLRDYTSGIIFAMATSVSAARRKAIAQGESKHERDRIEQEIRNKEPKELSGLDAAGYVYGGG